MKQKLPKTVTERGQLYLYANTEERKALLAEARERFPDAGSLSNAVFQALQEWKDYAEAGRLTSPILEVVAKALPLARASLRKEEDKVRQLAVYELLFANAVSPLREVIAKHAEELLGDQLSEEELLGMSRSSRNESEHPDGFWQSVDEVAREDEEVLEESYWIYSQALEEAGQATKGGTNEYH
ncbi:hypothetical protein ACFLR0_00785 [Candidatus Bipolaricaulota bacterium]